MEHRLVGSIACVQVDYGLKISEKKVLGALKKVKVIGFLRILKLELVCRDFEWEFLTLLSSLVVHRPIGFICKWFKELFWNLKFLGLCYIFLKFAVSILASSNFPVVFTDRITLRLALKINSLRKGFFIKLSVIWNSLICARSNLLFQFNFICWVLSYFLIC